MPRFKDQAICIRLIDWSETSQIVLLLCQQHGKLRGLAKGSKRTSPSSVARFSGGIELLTLGQVVAVVKPTTELATLTEWDLQASYWHLRQDLQAQRLGLYAADLTAALLADHDPHPKTFAALAQTLENLVRPADRQLALLEYQWRLLNDCGYRPQLDHDVRTGQPLPVRPDQSAPSPGIAHDGPNRYYVFDPRAGGLTIQSATVNGCWRVRPATVQLLARLAEQDSVRLRADPLYRQEPDAGQTISRANRLLCVYARAILDRQLPTMQYIVDAQAT